MAGMLQCKPESIECLCQNQVDVTENLESEVKGSLLLEESSGQMSPDSLLFC